jgi:hypothetical protein
MLAAIGPSETRQPGVDVSRTLATRLQAIRVDAGQQTAASVSLATAFSTLVRDGTVALITGGSACGRARSRRGWMALILGDRRAPITMRGRRGAAIRQLEFDARAHDDGALAGKPEVFGGVGGDS